ncbi:MAG TPA: SAM-dependent methyltransferase, partial [Desulfobacteria bacterium]|nr:SAM-dependent methyltransferase [Desulfobacteria bacterium]
MVKKAVQEDINIEVIPGAVAFVSGLVISGLPTAPVYFTGFLPSSGKGRRDALVKLKTIAATQVFYEAPHRIEKCLEDVRAVYGDVQVVIARELTKLHQELIRGTVSEVLDGFSHKEPRG